MKVVLPFLLFVVTLACSSTTKPEGKQSITTPKPTEEIQIITQELSTMGSEIKEKSNERKKALAEIEFSSGHYNLLKYYDHEILSEIDIDFHYANDSLAQKAFIAISEHFNKGEASNNKNKSFLSWESASLRDFVVKILLTNKSKFYGKPVVEIKLIEDDNRKYQR